MKLVVLLRLVAFLFSDRYWKLDVIDYGVVGIMLELVVYLKCRLTLALVFFVVIILLKPTEALLNGLYSCA